MTIVRFIENRYQELTLELQMEYQASVDCEIKALHWVLTTYRTILKWIYIPKVLIDFFSVRMGWVDEPKSPLLDKLRAEKAEKEVAQAH